MNAQLTSARDRLKHAFSLVPGQGSEEEVLSHWARYLCVLLSGHIEESVRLTLTDFCKDKAHRSIANYVESRLDTLTNLNEEKLHSTLCNFNVDWGENFRATRTDAQKDALNSVIANRNQIAHGRSVGLTLSTMKNYYREVKSLLRLVENTCKDR